MGWRLRVELRRRWRPAPGWPPTPTGFAPPRDWVPDPTWPAAPDGWTGWEVHRGRLIAAIVLSVFAAFGVFGVLKSESEANRQSVLSERGVTTSAVVLHSSYDSGAGDPGGWTTDAVTFTDRSGHTVAVTVGHHYDDAPEQATARLAVIYDPTHPTTAMSVIDYQDDPSAGGVFFGIALLALVVSTAIGFLISALRFTVVRTSTGQGLLTA